MPGVLYSFLQLARTMNLTMKWKHECEQLTSRQYQASSSQSVSEFGDYNCLICSEEEDEELMNSLPAAVRMRSAPRIKMIRQLDKRRGDRPPRPPTQEQLKEQRRQLQLNRRLRSETEKEKEKENASPQPASASPQPASAVQSGASMPRSSDEAPRESSDELVAEILYQEPKFLARDAPSEDNDASQEFAVTVVEELPVQPPPQVCLLMPEHTHIAAYLQPGQEKAEDR
jgi:hypothetical protein